MNKYYFALLKKHHYESTGFYKSTNVKTTNERRYVMKRVNLFIAGIILLFLCSACREEHTAPVNQLVKDLFCFQTGSEWTYCDSISHSTQKMIVTNYDLTRFAPKPLGGRKAYDWAEWIEMEITVSDSKKTTRLNADIDKDNTANGYIFTPTRRHLNIRCDENNNFIFPASATYLNTYTINDLTYSDVYVFNEHGVTYYVSKHIGFIRCVKSGYFDLVLIDKNILQ